MTLFGISASQPRNRDKVTVVTQRSTLTTTIADYDDTTTTDAEVQHLLSSNCKLFFYFVFTNYFVLGHPTTISSSIHTTPTITGARDAFSGFVFFSFFFFSLPRAREGG